MKSFKRLGAECPICLGQTKKRGCYKVGEVYGCRESVLEPNHGLEAILENGYTHKLDKLQVFYLYRPRREKREYTDIERAKFKLEIALKKVQLLQKEKDLQYHYARLEQKNQDEFESDLLCWFVAPSFQVLKAEYQAITVESEGASC